VLRSSPFESSTSFELSYRSRTSDEAMKVRPLFSCLPSIALYRRIAG
jgi:hypothetical protein